MPVFELPDYGALTLQLVLIYALAGFFGALVRVAWLDKPLRGVYKDESGGFRMGFFAEIIVAVGVAIVVDGHPIRAGLAAVFAPFLLDAVQMFIRQQVPGILRYLVTGQKDNPEK